MNGFSILMLIFAICTLFIGLYMYMGHEWSLVSWRVPFNDIGKEGWKK